MASDDRSSKAVATASGGRRRRVAARLLRTDGGRTEPDDSQWAPSADPADRVPSPSARTPDPWPPPPLRLPPGWGDPPAQERDAAAAPGGRTLSRRMVTTVVTVAVLAVWVGFAVLAGALSSRPATSAATASQPGGPTATGPGPDDTTFGGGLGGGFGGNGVSRRSTSGTITSISPPTLTVSIRGGQYVLVTTSGTTTVTRQAHASVAAVKPGQTIVASGTPSATAASIAADQITVVAPGSATGAGRSVSGGQLGMTVGTVSAVAGDTVTVAQPDGTTVQVVASPATTVTTMVAARLQDLAAGQPVVIRGTVADDGSVQATSIEEGTTVAAFPGGGPAFGRVIPLPQAPPATTTT